MTMNVNHYENGFPFVSLDSEILLLSSNKQYNIIWLLLIFTSTTYLGNILGSDCMVKSHVGDKSMSKTGA